VAVRLWGPRIASKLVTPMAGMPSASARPRAAETPMRMPVKLPGPDADGDGVERVERQFPSSASTSSISGMRRSACPFAMASKRCGEDPVATQQSGRAMRGRCVEAEDEGLRR
jgi:hypothetical protein